MQAEHDEIDGYLVLLAWCPAKMQYAELLAELRWRITLTQV